MSKNNSKNLVRRDFLGLIGGGGLGSRLISPQSVFVQAFVQGIINQARAAGEASAIEPRRYIFVGMPGGPPRWTFDLCLDPMGTGILRNPHVNSRFTTLANGSYGAPEYASVPITAAGVTYNMPSLWSNTIAIPGGGFVPMANLMSNMLIMRGISMDADGHSNNYQKQLRPVSSAPSLDGQVADGSSKTIPSLGLGRRPIAYSSKKGIGQSINDEVYSSSDPFTKILGPFIRTQDGLNAGYLNRRLAMENVMNQAMKSLGEYANSAKPGAENLFALRGKAETLLKSSFGNLLDSYRNLYNKYNSLITASIAAQINGISDRAVNYSSIPKKTIMVNQAQKIVALQTSLNSGDRFATNSDLRTIITNQTSVIGLAESFAVAEFMIKNNYSSAVTLGLDGLNNLNFTGIRKTANPDILDPDEPKMNWGADEHQGGSYNSLIINSYRFRCIASCLFELINSLKAAGIFDESVIQLGSEMSRSPHISEKGSDHGWQSNVVSIFSGAVKKPLVIGNIMRNSTESSLGSNAEYPGTWGVAAPLVIDGASQIANIGHATSTIAKILRVAPLSPNNGSLVTESADGVTSNVETPKNV